jgi:hypothetical protein
MSKDLEAIETSPEEPTAELKLRVPTITTALLGAIATSLVILVMLGFAILRQERRQSCAMRWTFPMLIQPAAPSEATQLSEARASYLVALNACFGVTP